MQYLDNAEFDLTPIVAGATYNLKLRAGREAPPVDAKQVILVMADDAGNMARVLVDIDGDTTAEAGATATIKRIFSTTETNNAIPNFGAGQKALSSDVAVVMMIARMNLGVIYTGQSNAVGWNNGKVSLSRKWFVEEDNRIKAQYNNDPDIGSKIGYGIEPLPHGSISLSGSNNLGPFIPLAHLLLQDGYNQVTGILHAVNAASISIYDDQQTHFLLLCDKIENFLNDSPLNHLGLWVHQQGETDQGAGMTPATWITKNQELKANVRAEMITRTGVDIFTLPYIAVGMHEDYRNSAGYDNVNDMEQGNVNLPANMDYSAYVPLGAGLSITQNNANGESGTDDTHIAAHAYHTVVAPAIYNAIPVATMNVPSAVPDTTPPALSSPTAAQTGSTTGSGSVTTNEGNGTLYYLVSENASETAATIKAANNTENVTTVGVQNVSLTGLTPLTQYYIHFVQDDGAGNESNVQTSNSFVTQASDTTAPTLTLPTGTETGHVTAAGTVTTDEANGTLYYLVSTNASETAGTIVGSGQNQTVTTAGLQNVNVSGLTAETQYYLHYVQDDAVGNRSSVVSSAAFTTQAAPDTTAPILSSPTGAQTGQTTADGTVSTDEGNGALYYLVSTNSSETASAIKAAGNQTVSASGLQNISFTGLTAGTTYYAHYVQDDASGNESNVVSSTAFTTQAAGPNTPNTDALTPLHHFRADFGLTTGAGNDFAGWATRGTGSDMSAADVLSGNPQVDANGVNSDGDDILGFILDGLLNNAAGSSFVMKFKVSGGGYLFAAPSNAGISLDALGTNAIWWQGFLGNNQNNTTTDLDDDVEHVLAITLSDTGGLKIYVDDMDTQEVDDPPDGFSLTTGIAGLLGAANGANGCSGYIKAIVAKPAVEWNSTNLNHIKDEMPA